MKSRIWEVLGDQFCKETGTQLLRDIFEHWVSILSYFQVGKGRGDHSVSIFHVSLSGYNEKSFKLLSSNYWKT